MELFPQSYKCGAGRTSALEFESCGSEQVSVCVLRINRCVFSPLKPEQRCPSVPAARRRFTSVRFLPSLHPLQSFNAHFLVSCLEKETRTAEARVFHADICEVFRGKKVLRRVRHKPVAARVAYLQIPRNTNVHVCDTSERVLTQAGLKR